MDKQYPIAAEIERLSTSSTWLAGMVSIPGGFMSCCLCLDRLMSKVMFLQGFEAWMPWAANPLYALLHESIYCQQTASNWAAEEVRRVRYFSRFFGNLLHLI